MSPNNSAWPAALAHDTPHTPTRSTRQQQAYIGLMPWAYLRVIQSQISCPLGCSSAKSEINLNLDPPLLQAREPARPRRNASDAQYTPALRVQRPINIDLL